MATSESGWCGDSRRSERDEHHLPALSDQGQTQPPDSGDFQVHQRKLRLQSECRRGGRPERVEEGPDRPECTQQKAHRPCSEYWGARLSAGGLDAINGSHPQATRSRGPRNPRPLRQGRKSTAESPPGEAFGEGVLASEDAVGDDVRHGRAEVGAVDAARNAQVQPRHAGGACNG